jgi:arginine decarboxylase
VYLPTTDKKEKEPLYLGFFHTGAYQDAISGYGGTKHCLIPSPKHILIDRDAEGNLVSTLFNEEQTPESMLDVLGY